MMNKEELLVTLETLHNDLSNLKQVDQDAEQLLRTITDDVRRLIDDRQESPQDDSKALASRLQSLVLSWEADHPHIASLIGRAADALSGIGI